MELSSLLGKHPVATLAGVFLILSALWGHATGRIGVFYGFANRSDSPFLFWSSVLASVVVGAGAILASYL